MKSITTQLTILLCLIVTVQLFCVKHQDCAESQFCTSIYNQEKNKCISKQLLAKVIGHQVVQDSESQTLSHVLAQVNEGVQESPKSASSSSFYLESDTKDQSLQVNIQSSSNSSLTSFSEEAKPSNFSIKSNSKSIIQIEQDGDVMMPKVQFQDVTISAKKLLINNIPQWQIWHRDDFEESPKTSFEWSDGNYKTSVCSGVTMLGGHCITSKEVLTRQFKKLPQHSELKIKFKFHFIDAWSGENAFLKIVSLKNKKESKNPAENHEKIKATLWNAGYKYTSVSKGLNMCGNEQIDQGRFIQNVEVQFKHNDQNVDVQIGTTLTTDACYSSYGISDFQIYTL